MAQAPVALWDMARGDTAPLGVSPSSFQHPSADTMPDGGHPGEGLGHAGSVLAAPRHSGTAGPSSLGAGGAGGVQGARSRGAEAASVPLQLQQEHLSRSPPNVCAEIQQRLRNEEPAVAETRSAARAAGPGDAAAGARGMGRLLQPAPHGTGTCHGTRTWHSTGTWHSTAHHGTAVPQQKQRCDAKC